MPEKGGPPQGQQIKILHKVSVVSDEDTQQQIYLPFNGSKKCHKQSQPQHVAIKDMLRYSI